MTLLLSNCQNCSTKTLKAYIVLFTCGPVQWELKICKVVEEYVSAQRGTNAGLESVVSPDKTLVSCLCGPSILLSSDSSTNEDLCNLCAFCVTLFELGFFQLNQNIYCIKFSSKLLDKKEYFGKFLK